MCVQYACSGHFFRLWCVHVSFMMIHGGDSSHQVEGRSKYVCTCARACVHLRARAFARACVNVRVRLQFCAWLCVFLCMCA